MSFPLLSLVPLTDTGTCCLHEGDTGAEFQAILRPSGWDDALAIAEIEGFELLDGGTLWLDGPEPPSVSNTGTVTIHTPWLRWGTLSASASVHWCISGGSYCHACGTVHTETDSCSHGTNCAARFSDDEDCDCPPMFLRVNFDDDDIDDVEDRYETPDFAWEDELEEFRFAGTGDCCCGCGRTGDARARIAFLSSGLRLWSEDGTRLLTGDDVSAFASVEATAHSPTNGAFLLRYDILDRTGGVVRAMSRRFTAANVEILPDMDEDGDFDADDYLLQESLGSAWTVVLSPTPYRVRLRNACPADATLWVLWSTEGTNGPAFSTDSNLTTQYLAPNAATTNAPFALPNLVDEFLIDASRTSSVATLTYSLDVGDASPAVADSLAIRIVDIDLPDRAVRPSELASVEYDLSAASENVAWTLEDTETGNVIDWDYSPTYAPPTALPLGDYEISAYVWDVWEDGAEGTMRTATLRVADIAIEHEAYAVQVGSTSRVRVALDASVSTNAANWSITPSGNGAPLLYTSETGGIGRFYINNATEVWVGADSDTGEYVLTANCHSATNVIAEATVFSVRVSVDVDYGRTGVPSDSPNENDSIDFFGPCGAIVFTNLDDDDGDGEPDATDSIVNGVQDHEDFTTFSISKLGIDCSKVPSSWRFVVQIQNSEGTAFSSDYTMFISLESGMEGGIVLVYQEESLLNLSGNGDILLGIESRTPGANGLVKCGLQCDGYVLNDSARVLSTPFFIHSPKDPAVECYVSHSVAPGVFEAFSQGCTGICSIIRSTDVPTVGQNNPMVYVRDHVCFGYTGMPTNHIDARRGELLLGLSPTEPDFSSLITDGTGFYFNAIDRNFGNLLLTPPDPMHPFGIAVCGTNFGYKAFLENQKVQRAGTSIPSIDVSWLAVPHVDNVVSFLPCGTAYVMLIADLDLATTILSLNASNPSYGENARMILESYSAQAENYAVVQGRLNAIRTYLAEHLGLADSAIVKVPVAFDVSSTSDVRPYFPNLVNLLYMERNGSCRILVPDAGFTPFWEQAQFGLRQKLLSLGFTLSDLVVVPTNIGSISPFRAGLGGDVHCISNVRYAMPSANGE